jgi:hypothetical protein
LASRRCADECSVGTRLRALGRIQDVDNEVFYHWSVAELLAHEALHEWWAAILRWPLGWWPWEPGDAVPPREGSIPGPKPFTTEHRPSVT